MHGHTRKREDSGKYGQANADCNGDGLPDLFEAIYIEMNGAFELPKKDADGRELQPSPLKHYAECDRWYENLGDGRFQSKTISRDVAKPGTSLGLIVTDFTGNGENEIFVGNDVRANHLLVQSGKNEFSNVADIRGVANGFSGAANGCMGIAAGDYNHDGKLDLFITNFSEESANLYLQQDGSGFTDLAIRYGLDTVSLPFVGFGTKAIDLDRNGWLDLLVTNGHIFDMTFYGEDYQMKPQCLMAHGRRFELSEVQDDSGYWNSTYLGRVMAAFDFDRDGDLDVLVNHLDQPLAVLRSETQTEGHWIQLELVGVNSGHRTTDAQYRSRGIWVDPSYRKHGVAQILFTMTEHQAILEECNMIWSIPRKSALPAYTKFGFKTVGDYFDEGMEFGPNIYVSKDLNEFI